MRSERKYLCTALLVFIIVGAPPQTQAAKPKQVFALYEKGVRVQEIALDGVLSKVAVKPVVLGEDNILRDCDEAASAVVAIGKPALDKALEYCRTTPVVFSLVSAPRVGPYKQNENVTGVSFDLSFRLFLSELQKVLKSGARIGFIYSSEVNEYLAGEMDYLEGEFNLISLRQRIDRREQIGATIKDLIENKKVAAIWVLPDPLYNQAIFKKLATVCEEKRVVLVTNFEALVKSAGAALALAPSYFDTGVQTAEIVQQILAGTRPAEIAYQRPRQSGVYLNLALFDKFGIELPNDLRYKEKVTTLINDGQDLLKEGKSSAALAKFREALRYDKKNTTAGYFASLIEARDNYAAATARLQQGNRRGALPLLLSAARVLPEARSRLAALRAEMRTDFGVVFQQGVQQFKARRYRECIQSMNLALMIEPGHQEATLYKEKAEKRAKAVTAIR